VEVEVALVVGHPVELVVRPRAVEDDPPLRELGVPADELAQPVRSPPHPGVHDTSLRGSSTTDQWQE
jgi:hypothetical protein